MYDTSSSDGTMSASELCSSIAFWTAGSRTSIAISPSAEKHGTSDVDRMYCALESLAMKCCLSRGSSASI